MNYLFYLLFFLLISNISVFAKTSEVVKQTLQFSWMVEVVGVSTGSGVAVARIKEGTLIMTNDHVCQSSRGVNPLSGAVKHSSKLNSHPVFVNNLKQRHPARVVKVSNLEYLRPPKKGSDLCLLYVAKPLPVATFKEDGFESGDELFGIGAPSGFFPSIYQGYAGALITSKNPSSVENPSLFVSMYANHGSSGGGVFDTKGRLGALTYAIVQDDQNNSPVVTVTVPLIYMQQFLNDYLEYIKLGGSN